MKTFIKLRALRSLGIGERDTSKLDISKQAEGGGG